MRKYDYTEQLRLPFVDVVKEGKQEPAKRLNIVSVKFGRESSLLYKKRRITGPEDAFQLFKQFLGQVVVSKDILIDEFRASLPKQTIIVDSKGNEHQLDLSWDIRPFNFDNYKKPGTTTLTSKFFKLPLIVSNSTPSTTRLEVKLRVVFQ